MAAYLLKRILLIFPTMIGIMLISFAIIQFAPGGPIERVLAQLSGSEVSATARIGGGQGDGIAGQGANPTFGQGGEASKYRGAQGLDPKGLLSRRPPRSAARVPISGRGVKLFQVISSVL